MMHEFSFTAFEDAGIQGRKDLCRRFSRYLTERILPELSGVEFVDQLWDEIVERWIKKITDCGHAMWCWDTSPEIEHWGCDYTNDSAYGLSIMIVVDEDVEVYWREKSSP